ncbi:hypothetical protein ACLOJK_037934 [Asimina triloba]
MVAPSLVMMTSPLERSDLASERAGREARFPISQMPSSLSNSRFLRERRFYIPPPTRRPRKSRTIQRLRKIDCKRGDRRGPEHVGHDAQLPKYARHAAAETFPRGEVSQNLWVGHITDYTARQEIITVDFSNITLYGPLGGFVCPRSAVRTCERGDPYARLAPRPHRTFTAGANLSSLPLLLAHHLKPLFLPPVLGFLLFPSNLNRFSELGSDLICRNLPRAWYQDFPRVFRTCDEFSILKGCCFELSISDAVRAFFVLLLRSLSLISFRLASVNAARRNCRMVSSEEFGGSPPPPLAAKQYGVTKPISMAGPTDADLQRTLELEKFLAESGLNESKEEAIKREEVLGQIDQIVKAWVRQLTRQRGYTEQMVEEANAVIFTFGSYRLGLDEREEEELESREERLGEHHKFLNVSSAPFNANLYSASIE